MTTFRTQQTSLTPRLRRRRTAINKKVGKEERRTAKEGSCSPSISSVVHASAVKRAAPLHQNIIDPMIICQRLVKWTPDLTKRFHDMMKCAAYNLNGGADNAVSEALALAFLHRSGTNIPERDLLRCAGFGFDIPGTPDGAIVLSHGRMAAVQVVRAGMPKGKNGIGLILSAFIVKVYKSLEWLVRSGLGDGVVTFTIALWIPRRLSGKAFSSLRNKLQSYAYAIDPRFKFVLLVPPCSNMRSIIFPPKFGAHMRGLSNYDESLMTSIRGLSSSWKRHESWKSPRISDEDVDLGFLEIILGQ
mmetsp:Transcript_4143/g.4855  ORF Transcript_4143/g.4855 Transcript_4143/m.4855 type:complete len:302 (-) Transcript_4143:125-1030(-)